MYRAAAGLVLVLGLVLGLATIPASAGRAAVPTFTKDVAPIVFNRCATCHRPGEAAPMPLLSYEDARPWSKSIKEVVLKRQMPPWFADAHSSTRVFRNDRRMTQAEIDTIVAWVDGGAPKGNPADMPPLPQFADGWTFGQPDLVVEMPIDYQLPAEGEIPMQNFYVPVPFSEDKWVQAVELRPGNREAVHHSIVNVVTLPPGTKIVDGRAVRGAAATPPPAGAAAAPRGSGVTEGGDQTIVQTQENFTASGNFKLIGQAPGKGAERHRDGVAKRISPGSYFQFNMHYQPTGRVEKDRSRLGIWFAKGPVHHEAYTQGVNQIVYIDGKPLPTRRIPNIPPNVDNWEIVGEMPVKEDITLLAMSPHMHLRGKDMKYSIVWPDGREETILDVPKFDFNWQLHYELADPIQIPAGSRLRVVAHYDNSRKNPYNPAPDKEVFWAEQSWDEMFIPWTEYTIDSRVLNKSSSK